VANARADFNALVKEKNRQKLVSQKTELRQVAQSVVPMHAVTNSAEWNFFLSLIQTKIEELAGILSALQESQVLDPSFDHAGLASYKAQMMRVAEQKRTLEMILELPSNIMKDGEKARFALHSIEEA